MSEELSDFGEGAGSVELSLECANAQEVMNNDLIPFACRCC